MNILPKIGLFLLYRLLVSGLALAIGLWLIYAVMSSAPDNILGLSNNRPVPEQESFGAWLERLQADDFGTSLTTRRPVKDTIEERLPASVELLSLSGFFSFLFGIPLGILIGGYHGIAQVVRPLVIALIALPIFWLGLLLLNELGIKRDQFPLGGRFPTNYALTGEVTTKERLDHLVLPLMTMTLPAIGGIALAVRHLLLSSEERAGIKLAGRVLGGVVLLFPMWLAFALNELVVVEMLFSWPGIGRLAFGAVLQIDYALIVGVLYYALNWTGGAFIGASLVYGLICLVFNLPPQDYLLSPSPAPIGLPEDRTAPALPRSRQTISNILTVLAVIVFTGLTLLFLLATPLIDAAIEQDPFKTNIAQTFLPPGEQDHLLGTDDLGRDLASRWLIAGRTSLRVAFGAALLSAGIALVLGIIAGVPWGILGRLINWPITGLATAFYLLPLLLFLIFLSAVLSPSTSSLAGMLGLVGWPSLLPAVRYRVAILRDGVRFQRLSERGGAVIGGLILTFIYMMALGLAQHLILETTLSFLGVGVKSPTPSLGNMLNNFQTYMSRGADAILYAVGLSLIGLVGALLLIAERIRDTFDYTFPAPTEEIIVVQSSASEMYIAPNVN